MSRMPFLLVSRKTFHPESTGSSASRVPLPLRSLKRVPEIEPGGGGRVVLMVTDSADDWALMLPAVSLARAATLYVPLASVEVVIDQVPVLLAIALPTTMPLARSSTIVPAEAVPLY